MSCTNQNMLVRTLKSTSREYNHIFFCVATNIFSANYDLLWQRSPFFPCSASWAIYTLQTCGEKVDTWLNILNFYRSRQWLCVLLLYMNKSIDSTVDLHDLPRRERGVIIKFVVYKYRKACRIDWTSLQRACDLCIIRYHRRRECQKLRVIAFVKFVYSSGLSAIKNTNTCVSWNSAFVALAYEHSPATFSE